MEADADWETVNDTSDAIGLLEIIQRCMSQRQTRKYEVHTLIEAEAEVMNFKQGQYMADNDYFDKFKDKLATAIRMGSTLGAHPHGVEAILQEDAVVHDEHCCNYGGVF